MQVIQAAYRVVRLILVVLSNQWPVADLEEACQTAILRLWQYVASGNGRFSEDKDVAAWLFKSVPRRLITNYRKDLRRREWEHAQGGTFVLERFPDTAGYVMCREALRFLEGLDLEDRALLLERGIDGDGEALSTGKSHLAQALGHRACRAGHAVLYVAAQDLLKQLRAARADGSYDRRMLRFTAPELLIIDDLGLRPLTGEEPIDLYELIRQRYERSSTLLTSNRAIEELPPLFGDALLASAAMDRLLHGAQVLVLDGDSYRNPPAERSRKAAPKANKEVSR